MDISLFSSLFSFQKKMKPVLKSIKNIFSMNSYVMIEIDYISSFKKIDGIVVYVYSLKKYFDIHKCKYCKNGKFIDIDDGGQDIMIQSLNFYTCRCAIENLNERFDFDEHNNDINKFDYKKYIIYKCCSICGFYLYGGTPALQCSNQSHFKKHNLKRMEEDKKYLKHILEIEFTCVQSRKYFINDDFNMYQNGISTNLSMINAIAFHLETKYFFVDHEELFELVFEFIDMHSTFIYFGCFIHFNDFYNISKMLFEFHKPPQKPHQINNIYKYCPLVS